MAAQRKRLTARSVATIPEPGRHSDGGNLYLNVTATGARSWTFMWSRAGRQREMGLGSALDVTLASARDLAEAARREIREGRDPLASKRKAVAADTFGEAADAYVEAMRPQWKSGKHAEQWAMTLRDYAAANLAALCQRCHILHDRDEHLRRRRPTCLARGPSEICSQDLAARDVSILQRMLRSVPENPSRVYVV